MPSLSFLFKESWQLYKEKFLALAFIILLPIILIYLLNLVLPISEINALTEFYINSLGNPDAEFNIGFDIFWYFVLYSVLAAALFLLSFIAMIFNLWKNSGVIESYSLAFKNLLPFIWMTILASAVKMGGFLLAIIPGIIISIWFIFSGFTLIEENKKGMKALLLSREYIRGHWWAVLGRIILLTLIVVAISALISLIPDSENEFMKIAIIVILQLIITPAFMVYMYAMYKQLKKIKSGIDKENLERSRGFLILAGVIGLVAPSLLFTWIFFL